MKKQLLIIREKNLKENSSQFYLETLLEKIKSFLKQIYLFATQYGYQEILNDFLGLIKKWSCFKAYSPEDFFRFIEKNYFELSIKECDTSAKLFFKKKKINEDYLNKRSNKKNENYIHYLNFHIEFLSEIMNISQINKMEHLIRYDYFKEDFDELIKNIEWYSYKFDKKNNNIVATESFLLLENIFVEPLNKIVYKYKSSINLEDKESIFADLAKRMLHVLEQNSKYRKALKTYFTDDLLDQYKKECNAYFRHASSDLKNNKLTEIWVKFTSDEKIDIMNKTLNVYLFILSVLRTENLLERFEDSFNN